MTGRRYACLRDAILDYDARRSKEAMEHCLMVLAPKLELEIRKYARFMDRHGNPVDRQEMLNEALLYVMENIGKFTPNPEASDAQVRGNFIDYFVKSTKPIIRKHCQQQLGPVSQPEWVAKYAARITRAMQEIAEEQEGNFKYGNLDPKDVARRSGAPLSRVKLFLNKGLGRLPGMLYVGYDELAEGNLESAALGDEMAGKEVRGTGQSEHEIDHNLLSDETKEFVALAWREMSDMQKQVLSLLYGFGGDPVGRRGVASSLGVTEHRVREAEKEGLELIRQVIARPVHERASVT